MRAPGLPHLWGARSPSSVRLNPFRNRGLIAPTNNGRNRMIRPMIRFGLGLLAAAWAGAAGAAEIKLLSSAAMTTVLEDLVPKFEKATGHKVTLVLATSGALNKRVAEGETADLLISTGAGIDGLIKDGKQGLLERLGRRDIWHGRRREGGRPQARYLDARGVQAGPARR